MSDTQTSKTVSRDAVLVRAIELTRHPLALIATCKLCGRRTESSRVAYMDPDPQHEGDCPLHPSQVETGAILSEFTRGAREGWMRACVLYVDLCAESDPAVIAEMDRRWPLRSQEKTKADPARDLLREVADALLCCGGTGHYCPNCDRSTDGLHHRIWNFLESPADVTERRGDPNGLKGKAGHYWTCAKCHYLNDASIRFNRCGGCGEFQKGYADPRSGEP
jgi:hypothetical protein